MERWFNNAPFEAGAQQAFRSGRFDAAYLAAVAERLERRKLLDRFAERAAPVGRLLEIAPERPAMASTLVWHALGTTEPTLASSLIQSIRERAGLPGLRKPISKNEAPPNVDIAWFDDRQVEDAARWAEQIPAPHSPTLAEAIARIERQRAVAGASLAELIPFIQRIASFLLALSKSSVDPLGFALSHDACLLGDPPIDKRVEVAHWARTVGRTLCLRGQMAIMTIDVSAPWRLALEVIAGELGRGISGAFGIVMRLRGHVALPATQAAPLLLCLPDEPIELRGARFERWCQRAYPHAVDPWRAVA